jgi:photosystem II stability/assembly factor-like uncharacterized protein
MLRLLVIVLFLLTATHGRAQWIQMPFPTTADVLSIASSNPDTGYAVTAQALYRTTNGGASWVLVYTPPPQHQLIDVNVPKFARGLVYAVGGYYTFDFGNQTQDVRNFIAKSSDGGATWQTAINSAGSGVIAFQYVYFITNQVGFAAGSSGPFLAQTILRKTTNGGQNWIDMPGALNIGVYGGEMFDFLTDSIGYQKNLTSVLKSSNQGTSWTIISFPDVTKASFVSIQEGFGDTRVILSTTDGGSAWQRIGLFDLGIDMLFFNRNVGYVVCDSGKIFKTTTGDSIWV